ncbi:MAG: DUF6273 domain-containing protein [Lachnospiraceae bacterium]|nr:DUF6273 domain-containing protein [Lachnospiraceae bacterium]
MTDEELEQRLITIYQEREKGRAGAAAIWNAPPVRNYGIYFGRFNGESIFWLSTRSGQNEQGRFYVDLITRDCICRMQFTEHYENAGWEKSSLRQWLNTDFFDQAFSQEEKQRILMNENYVTADNHRPIFHKSRYATEDILCDGKGFGPLSDRVWLPDIEYYERYLSFEGTRKIETFWLRSTGFDKTRAAIVENGSVVPEGWVGHDMVEWGVRPCIRISL